MQNKDYVPPLSFHDDEAGKRHIEDVGERLGAWDFALGADSEAYAEELREYVKKFSAVSRV